MGPAHDHALSTRRTHYEPGTLELPQCFADRRAMHPELLRQIGFRRDTSPALIARDMIFASIAETPGVGRLPLDRSTARFGSFGRDSGRRGAATRPDRSLRLVYSLTLGRIVGQ